MSIHNICFCGEVRIILCGNPHLSGVIIHAHTKHFGYKFLRG